MLRTPLAQIISRPGVRCTCDRCGEEIINEREVVVSGECLCRACAGDAYYDVCEGSDGRIAGSAYFPLVGSGDSLSDALERRVSQRTQELMALFDISQEIVAQLDLDTLLGAISDQARALLQAQATMLCLLDAKGDALQLAGSSGLAGAQPGVSQSTTRGLASQVIGGGQNVVSRANCTNCALLQAFGPSSCIAVPLCAGENTIGALCVVRASEQAFDIDQARSLRLLANAAAIAINNARLAETARQEAARAAAYVERERLAAELHDSLAQTLAFLNLKTGVLASQLQESAGEVGDATERVASELASMASVISTAYAQVRAALTGLQRPAAIPNDLAAALDQIVTDFRATSGSAADLVVDLVIADKRALAIPGDAQSQVKHIMREALTNIRRHAQAHHVQVSVACSCGSAFFVVADDGCGFDPQSVDTRQHMGLAIMHRRVASCGGQLRVESAPGTGTRIVASFPLEQSGEDEQ
jgi:two-component system nitrate/nitrite sensor histidine kinase NarX